MASDVTIRLRFTPDDGEISHLHALAFRSDPVVRPWGARLSAHSLTWVGAFDDDALVGFVNVIWDGGAHAFLLDTVVHPEHQRRGIGRLLVQAAISDASAAGCDWLHVDHEPQLADFYAGCGFLPSQAGLVRLT